MIIGGTVRLHIKFHFLNFIFDFYLCVYFCVQLFHFYNKLTYFYLIQLFVKFYCALDANIAYFLNILLLKVKFLINVWPVSKNKGFIKINQHFEQNCFLFINQLVFDTIINFFNGGEYLIFNF